MRTISYDDKSAPWSRNNPPLETKRLFSTDGSRKDFYRTSQATFCQELLQSAYPSPPPQIFLYLSLKLKSVPQIWAEGLTVPLPTHGCTKLLTNLFSLPFTTTCLFKWCIEAGGRIWHVENPEAMSSSIHLPGVGTGTRPWISPRSQAESWLLALSTPPRPSQRQARAQPQTPSPMVTSLGLQTCPLALFPYPRGGFKRC
jgi:hypothetical protein